MSKTAKPMTPEQYLNHRLPAGTAGRLDHESEVARLHALDFFVRAVEAARKTLDLSKEEVAAKAHLNPAAVRRLLTAKDQNPSLKTLCAVAHGVGLRVVVQKESPPKPQLPDDTPRSSGKKLGVKAQHLPVF